jgi:ankyrin repeat protein
MPTRQLPNDPSFENLRKQAKRLLAGLRAGETAALAQVREFHPRREQAAVHFALADAQLVIARSYGFPSWAKLKQHLADIEPFVWNPPPVREPGSTVDVLVRLACLTYVNWHRSNPLKARRMLEEHPELAAADIYSAAAVGHVDALRAMVDQDLALVQTKGGPLRWEPLLYACYSRLEADGTRSSLEAARLLLSRGADPNAGFLFSGSYAFTALTGAFGRGEDWPNQPPHPDCDALARLLLDAGADPNDAQALYNRHFHDDDSHLTLLFEYGLGQEKGGPWLTRLGGENATPRLILAQQLCWAAIHNFPKRVTLLVEHGVDVNTPSLRDGRTAYESALRAGHHSTAEYLLAHGAKKIDLDPLETFALACIAGRREEVRARLAADPTLLDRLGHEGRVDLLHRAVDAKHGDGIRLIVELGVDINGMVPGTGLDRSVLHSAAGWGGLELVKLLLGLGADRYLRDPTYHGTPLGWALHNDNREVVDFLLPSATIFEAVQAGSVERVAELLRTQPSLSNALDDAGNPLVVYLHPELTRVDEMLRVLRSHGTDVNARTKSGKTLLDLARADGSADFAQVLRAHGALTSAELLYGSS